MVAFVSHEKIESYSKCGRKPLETPKQSNFKPICNQFFANMPKTYIGEWTASSINGAEKSGYPSAEK
jgi:hypothetical protein